VSREVVGSSPIRWRWFGLSVPRRSRLVVYRTVNTLYKIVKDCADWDEGNVVLDQVRKKAGVARKR
jgi:hypothetical protein